MKRTGVVCLFAAASAALLSTSWPAFAQTTLGTSASSTSPQRSGEASTGLFTPGSGAVAVSSLGTEMMRVNGTGVGIGTTSPQAQLDVFSTSSAVDRGIHSYQYLTGGYAAVLSLDKADGTVASPIAAANGEYVGAINSRPYDGSNFLDSAGILGRVNGTVSTGSVPQDLLFYTTGGANDNDPYANSHVRMVINSGGDVGIGTTAPTRTLEVAGPIGLSGSTFTGSGYEIAKDGANFLAISSGSAGFRIIDSTSATEWVRVTSAGKVGIGTASPAQALEVNGQVQVDSWASSTSTQVCKNGNVLATCNGSSIRYKENVRNLPMGLRDVMRMRPVTFKWKDRDETDFGFIAEEMHDINPLYNTYEKGQIEGVKYQNLTAVLVNAIKEQQREISDLKRAVADLKATATTKNAVLTLSAVPAH